ncbi:ATP-binding protein [Chloroflexota bacterium]
MKTYSKEQLESIVSEYVADLIWIADSDNRIIFVSPSVEKFLGYTVNEAMSFTIEDVFTPESVEYIKKLRLDVINKVMKEHTTDNGLKLLELEMCHRNGSIINIEINGNIISDDNGYPIGFLCVARDVTEIKQARKQILKQLKKEKELKDNLEAEISKRSEFARILVHELKTPLTSILASAELLLESGQKAPYDRLTKGIYRSSSDLNKRIGELLELTRAEVGKLRIKPRRINPSIMIVGIIRDIETIVSYSKLHLRTQVPSTLPYIKADRKRIRQVMQNLVNNAIQATPEGGEIVIRAIENNDSLMIQVQDTGRGIKLKDQAHVFEPYYRVSGIAERYAGLGLGLALSKRIVELHDGQIWVESKLGKGSTFTFSIPLSINQ